MIELELRRVGLRLAAALPDGAYAAAPVALDLSAAPGARLELQGAWQWGGSGALQLACVEIGVDRWVPGLERPVLGGATALVREAAGLGSVWAGEPVRVGSRFEQSYRAESADGAAAARGLHVLGFVGHPAELMLCSAVCLAPARATGACDTVLGSLRVEAAFVEPPPPGVLAAAALLAARHPAAAALGLAALLALGAAWLLGRRPRRGGAASV
ncbi:MAG: hypothetical protein HY744_28975 [Deltaproteobacteria bacterium]|nr:hypothetical protein [Deltaproteobacteria bacterium]